MQDLSIVIPSYNESHEILQKLYEELTSLGAEVIIVDDGSDVPFPKAIKHGINFGYGGAVMTGIKNATRSLVLTLDGDGQHPVSEVVKLYHAFKLIADADMVVGTRKLTDEIFYRFLGRKFLNWVASFFCLRFFPDLNSGCRIFKRDIATGYFSILCRTFSFTTSLTVSMLCDNYRVEFFPINVEKRVLGTSNVNVFKDGLTTLYYIVRNGLALRTRKIRAWKRSLFSR